MQCLQTVLLGDAAHTMTPALGQGLNSGLEDVAVFAQCLRDFGGDVDVALPAYTRARLPDIKAIMTINEVVASSDVGVASQVSKSLHPACISSDYGAWYSLSLSVLKIVVGMWTWSMPSTMR